MKKTNKTLIIHVAKNPLTGVWSSMKSIVRWQMQQENTNVAVAIFSKKDWPQHYQNDLNSLDAEKYQYKIPNFRMSYLLIFINNKLENWIEELYRKLAPSRIAIHFHNADFSGIFVPVNPKVDCDISMVSTFHGMPGIDPKFKLRRPWQKWLHSRLRKNKVKFVSVDRKGVDQATKILGYNDKEFSIIPNGIFAPQETSLHNNYSNKALQVGFIGSIDSNKGWEIVIDAAIKTHSSSPTELIIIGTGPRESEIQPLIQEKNYIKYLGFVENAAENIIPKLDVLVIASKVEGLPMVVIEALANGVAVISTNVGAIAEAVIHGKHGFIVERTSDDISKYLKILAKDRELLRQIKEYAVKQFNHKYEISKIGAEYLNAYFNLNN